MIRFLVLALMIGAMASCRSTKKIQTAIGKRDTLVRVTVPTATKPSAIKNDTLQYIQNTLNKVASNKINYQTFTGKVNVDYRGSNGKSYNVNANVRIYKDSA